MSSRVVSAFNVCKVNSAYWFRDELMGDDNGCSWPFGQVYTEEEVVEVDDEEKEESGDDEKMLFVCGAGDEDL